MILISALPAERRILSVRAESISLSAGKAEQQSTKSCSRKYDDGGGGRGDSCGGDRFVVGGGDNDCSDNRH